MAAMMTMASEPIAKRTKLEGDPVCILVNACSESVDSIYVYYLDLKEEERKTHQKLLEFAIRFTGVTFQTLAVVLKSTLYLLNIYDEYNHEEETFPQKAYKYRLDGTENLLDIDFNCCENIKPMSFMKDGNSHAVLVETESKTKICVFSGVLHAYSTGNFELYDPESDIWLTIPEPLHERDSHRVVYYFVEGAELFLNTTGGSFSINLSRSDDMKWVVLFELNYRVGVCNQPILKDDGWLITPSMEVLDMNDDYIFREIPFDEHVVLADESKVLDDKCIVRRPPENGERFRACIVQLGQSNKKIRCPRVLWLSLWAFHGKKFIPDLVFAKSFLLMEDAFINKTRFLIYGVFPM